eukprot:gnl/TRDRNA2_/TRDRNA2_125324_c0_seq1.p1 gnl/TRDRNA2_/TRDRNA2_125324_c0~~gnl/TRDRNA2_/TRDRNA2_125324_c0_seq1.p1  ORF type:complete len:119 (-),score=7.34 gnl/TRDRNA2_/TRDRNA2_125324_c0_seq1:105-461(-)
MDDKVAAELERLTDDGNYSEPRDTTEFLVMSSRPLPAPPEFGFVTMSQRPLPAPAHFEFLTMSQHSLHAPKCFSRTGSDVRQIELDTEDNATEAKYCQCNCGRNVSWHPLDILESLLP